MDTKDVVEAYHEQTKKKPSGNKIVIDFTLDPIFNDLGKVKARFIYSITKNLRLYDYKGRPIVIYHSKEAVVPVVGAHPVFDLLLRSIEYFIDIGQNASKYILMIHYLYQQYYDDLKHHVSYDDEIYERILEICDLLGVEDQP